MLESHSGHWTPQGSYKSCNVDLTEFFWAQNVSFLMSDLYNI